ncbi:hypothetical protein BCF58_3067 [Chryseobacterium defluvii]|uniref:Uncharacterized protein n=1 Tax=Chryseobacterium defluvii TaxID=160396 RepID=A0A495SBX4_9FLAO|nr:hypothetical protein BCF58_3067 [Chryseobacterium defluvii]
MKNNLKYQYDMHNYFFLIKNYEKLKKSVKFEMILKANNHGKNYSTFPSN